MFSLNVFASNTALMASSISTAIVAFVFLRMSFAYTKKRSKRRYAHGRLPAPSIASFRTLSKLLFVTSMLLTLASYWFSAIPLLTLHANPIVRLLGALVVLVGYVNLNRAFRHLGDHYSPLFDAHLPSALVTQGYYRRIRHPIYLFNLFVSAGLAVSSGSVIVAVNAIVGLFFVLRAISIEEAYLTRHFPDYRAYAQNSWRLIPFFY